MSKQAILRAMERRCVCRLSYTTSYNGNSQSTVRDIEPIEVRGNYVSAYCRMRADYRVFRFDRMNDVTMLDETFSPRARDPRAWDFMQNSRAHATSGGVSCLSVLGWTVLGLFALMLLSTAC